MSPKFSLCQPGIYRICVAGALDDRWTDYFDGMDIVIEKGRDQEPVTILTGSLLDQAALQGVLQKLYNLGFPLISAEHIADADQTHNQ